MTSAFWLKPVVVWDGDILVGKRPLLTMCMSLFASVLSATELPDPPKEPAEFVLDPELPDCCPDPRLLPASEN